MRKEIEPRSGCSSSIWESRMKKEPSLRKIDCPKYADCLGVAAHQPLNQRFDCRGCEKFSKWPYKKDLESILKVAPAVMEKIETETPMDEVIEMDQKETRPCAQCNKEFEPARKKSRLCSKACKNKWYLSHGKKDAGNGRRRIKPRPEDQGRQPCLPVRSRLPGDPVPIQGIYLDPGVIKAIQKSAAKQVLKDISAFLEERYS